MHFRADIQGLRALAFLLVFIFHLNPKWLPGGFIGVDLFFVISGYLMTSIILRQKEHKTFSFLTFYEKRIKRIVPALYFMLLCVSVVAYYFFLSSDINELTRSLRRAFLFISNHYFAEGTSYFAAESANNFVLHTWSLSIEMQFYLFLPFLLFFVNKRFLPYVVAVMFTLLTGLSCYWLYHQERDTFVYFSAIARIPEFLIGVLTSLLFSDKQIKGRVGVCLSAAGLAGIATSALFIDAQTPFPGLIALIPCLSLSSLLISGKNKLTELLASKPLLSIGEWSYSLYLWHWPVIVFVRYKGGWNIDYAFRPSDLIIIFIATIVFAGLSYYMIEKPFRQMSVKKGILCFAPVLLLLVAFLIFFPRIKSKIVIPPRYASTTYGKHLKPDDYVDTLGDTSALSHRIFLFGDSHALLTRYMMNEIGIKQGFGFKTLSTYGFPAIRGIDRNQIPKDRQWIFDLSQKQVDLTYEWIAQSDILVMGNIHFEPSSPLAQALDTLIAHLRPDQKLILFITYPILDRHPLKLNGSHTKKTDAPIQVVYNPAYAAYIRELDQKHPQVYTFDLTQSAIFQEAPYHNNEIIYYDPFHLNLYGSELLLADIEEELSAFFKFVMEDSLTTSRPRLQRGCSRDAIVSHH
jgi:peptidoglycan/LPS O-acetylase OafA/YrhL